MPALTPGAGEPSQRFLTPKAIPTAWWQLFRSRSLDAAVREAIADSPSLMAAQATLARAHQAVLQAEAPLYPWVDFTALAERQKPSFPLGIGNSAGSISAFNLHSFGPTVSYSPDVFGLTRRYVEEQQATAENQAYQLAAAYLTLTGNVVAEALTIASTRLQIGVVAIARALPNGPRIILADEPTAALDSKRASVVMDLLRRVAADQQGAILVVSHDEKIFDRFDPTFHLRDGRIESTDTRTGAKETASARPTPYSTSNSVVTGSFT